MALGLFVVALAVGVYMSLRPRPAARPAGVARLDPKAALEARGGTIEWTRRGRTALTVRFDRMLTYPDGRSVLLGIRAVAPARDGRSMVITAREAEQIAAGGQKAGRVRLSGDVALAGDNDLRATTALAVYDETEGLVHLPEPVAFRRGRVEGRSARAVYDPEREQLSLLGGAELRAAATPTEAPVDARARTAILSGAEHTVRLQGEAVVTRGGEQARADEILLRLSDDERQVRAMELRGSARVEPGAGGPLGALAAQEIDLSYDPTGQRLERAALRGGASVDLSSGGRRLSAERIDAAFDAAGGLARLDAAGKVELLMPADGSSPARTVRAAALESAPVAGGGHRFLFRGAVEYRETPRDGRERSVRAGLLDGRSAEAFGAFQQARFNGGVTIREGTTTAEAAAARYDPDAGLVVLERAGDLALPRVADDRLTVEAESIELTLGSGAFRARGTVRTLLVSSRRATSDDDHRLPTILSGEEPVAGAAARLDYDGASAVYAGGARLWQGETSIAADTIELDDRRGNLKATGKVQTRTLMDRTGRGTDRTERVESVGEAPSLVYEEAARRAVYDGGARLTGVQGELRADRIALTVTADGRGVERIEAVGGVTLRVDGGRTARGTRLVYHGDRERYEMSGTPVRVVERVDGGCRETLGLTLTFEGSADTITVVGTEGNRSRTRPGSCPELR
jgi:lipopolysaccharide export system protein LptA